MRVTGGIGKGRRLAVPKGNDVRPTSSKVKQALFNILGNRVADCAFLDLFAGAGGIGLEALCRGARSAVLVDGSRESVAAIKRNSEQAGVADRARIVTADVEAFLRKKSAGSFDIVFLDPPYALPLAPLLDLIAEAGIVAPGGMVIAEHFKKQTSPEAAGPLVRYRTAQYGDTVLAFYRQEPDGPGAGPGGKDKERP